MRLPLDLIQSIRLAHALMESARFEIRVPKNHAPTFSYLASWFNLTFGVADGTEDYATTLIDHESPVTAVGRLQRTLVFPHGVIERCRSKWVENRRRAFIFDGLDGGARRRTLTAWRRCADVDQAVVDLNWTNAGRRLPEKAWDDAYYDRLGANQFALCPNGDFVWTYRFFEAALCGALPVVEEVAPPYRGFEYATLADAVDSISWSSAAAEHNFDRARQLLAIAPTELDSAIESSRSSTLDPRAVWGTLGWEEQSKLLADAIRTESGGETYVLIDALTLASDRDRPGRPFRLLESDGIFAGLPADGAAAIAGLEDFRARGARRLIIIASEMWWFASYPEFGRHVESRYPRLRSDLLVVHDLLWPKRTQTAR